MSISVEAIKQLRELTGAGVMEAKRALEEAEGNLDKAKQIVFERGLAKAEKKSDRETKEGTIGTYLHMTGKVAAMVTLLCETDFVARNDEFVTLARELAMQAASMRPETVEELMQQEYIRDGKQTIEGMVKTLSAKVGENITVGSISIVTI